LIELHDEQIFEPGLGGVAHGYDESVSKTDPDEPVQDVRVSG
jgi:hypothetical protein